MKALSLLALSIVVAFVGLSTAHAQSSTAHPAAVHAAATVSPSPTPTPSATPAPAKPSYCGTTAYDLQYRAVYEYPTGSYWQTQIAAYPSYYAANDAYYRAQYGC